MLYFAYASCMDEDSFKETMGENNYSIWGAAKLIGYRLAFTRYGERRQGGIADVIVSPGDEVEGVLYWVRPQALARLDEREGVPHGIYQRENIQLWWNNNQVGAMTYTVVNKEEYEQVPHVDYARLILNGAERHLSESYRYRLIQEWKDRLHFDWEVEQQREETEVEEK
ncbi:gamma-glutamylcyclotransferase family protein [Mechercharimyces sp. CAU 1602]|uniref:gamma-glutamylcyclotransferase family protein n=1 Tax=Mechercharimyces sp. CAU 1602 TaxID=2973933 RepID=UPI0021622816|nr:gamma-glutamylcyclotransferase family protein [Mechercharimyces sp. CAU 1602]MCS1350203.1 gamma-glutamylcyclotransferase [Mechercharimyces sp. CAU 1602]